MKTNVIPDMYKKIARIAWEIENNPEINKKDDDLGLLKRKSKKQTGDMGSDYSPAYKAAIFLKAIRDRRREINDGLA